MSFEKSQKEALFDAVLVKMFTSWTVSCTIHNTLSITLKVETFAFHVTNPTTRMTSDV